MRPVALLLLAALAAPAFADTTIDEFEATVAAAVITVDENDEIVPLESDADAKSSPDSATSATFRGSATTSRATASADVDAAADLGTLRVSFDGTVTVRPAIAGANVTLRLRFTTTGPTEWSVSGESRSVWNQNSGVSTGFSCALVRVGDPSGPFRLEPPRGQASGDRFVVPIGAGGTLPAGQWELTCTGSSQFAVSTEDVGEIWFEFEVRPQSESSRYAWRAAASGAAGDARRWTPAGVPSRSAGRADDAEFAVGGTRAYRVQVGTMATRTLAVREGVVEFQSGTWTVSGGPLFEPATTIRPPAEVVLGRSVLLQTREVVIGGPGDFVPRLTLAHPEAELRADAGILVGDDGPGSLVVGGGSAECDLLVVDAPPGAADGSTVSVRGAGSLLSSRVTTLGARGSLLAESGARIEAGNVIATAPATLGCSGGRSGAAPRTVLAATGVSTGGLDDETACHVTAFGRSRLEVTGDLDAENLLGFVVSDGAGRAELAVGGGLRLGVASLLAGFSGDVTVDGDLAIEDGAAMTLSGGSLTLLGVADGTGDVTVGNGPGATTSCALVAGARADTLTSGRAWRIGSASGDAAELVVGDSADATGSAFRSMGDVELGRADGAASATLLVGGGSLVATPGTVFVRPGARLESVRGVAADVVNGKAPRTEPAPATIRAVVVNEGTVDADALAIDGGFSQGPGAVLVVKVRPGTGGAPLRVSGPATLGGTLVVEFTEGLAPAAAEDVRVAEFAGSVAGSFASIQVRGLSPGAVLGAEQSGGTLVVRPAAGTSPLPAVDVRFRGRRGLAESRPSRTATLLVSRSGPIDDPLEVTLSFGGTATAGRDFEALSDRVTLPAGRRSAKVRVRALDDARPERSETIDVRVVPGATTTRGRFARATVRIADDDTAQP